MTDKEMLVRNLFREIEKDRIKIIQKLIYDFDEYALSSKKGKKKITMIIKIEDIT